MSALVERWKADDGVEAPKEGPAPLPRSTPRSRAINRLCQEARQEAGLLGETRMFVNGDFLHGATGFCSGRTARSLESGTGSRPR